jgi:hypothetical protein
VLDSIEKAHSRLTEIPPNGKDSIRAVFASAEGLFKLMFPNETRLTASAARRQLLPVVQRIYAGDPPALTSASKMVASFSEWVDGAHPYRHEHGSEEVAQPPLELAANLLSLGITNVRWLAELDAKSVTTAKGHTATEVSIDALNRACPVEIEKQARPGEGGPVVAYAVRPYPSGGGCYELDLYLAVDKCEGLREDSIITTPADTRWCRSTFAKMSPKHC